MAFVTPISLGHRTVRLQTRSSRLSASSVRAVASSPGRSKVFDAFQSSQSTKQWVTPDAPEPEKAAGVPTGRSAYFFNFMQSTNRSDFGGPTKTSNAPADATSVLSTASTPFFQLYAKSLKAGYKSGGDARKKIMDKKGYLIKVDDYMAACVKKQYIMKQNPSGVFTSSCTEGAATYAAEEARVAALAFEFRRKQVSGVASFADYYETRKLAFAASGGCNYEESLVNSYPSAARSTVDGKSEMMGTCSRYAMPSSVEEKYMMDCVMRASSARATKGGIYNLLCSDGTTSGAAESKRVRALSVEFRNKQLSPLAATQRLYNQKKAAYYGCEYEDGLFTKYPATAACNTRPSYARY